jgi:hypothetical protein
MIYKQRSRLKFGRFSVRISSGTPVIVTEVLHGFPQYIQINVWEVPRLGCVHFFQILYNLSSIKSSYHPKL